MAEVFFELTKKRIFSCQINELQFMPDLKIPATFLRSVFILRSCFWHSRIPDKVRMLVRDQIRDSDKIVCWLEINASPTMISMHLRVDIDVYKGERRHGWRSGGARRLHFETWEPNFA